MRFTILTPDAQYPDDAVVERQVAGKDVEFLIYRTRDPAAIPLEHLEACDALLVWHEMKIDHLLIDNAKKCRVIVRAGVGYNQINLEDAAAAGIPVCNTPDYGTSEVADHAISSSCCRSFAAFQNSKTRCAVISVPLGNTRRPNVCGGFAVRPSDWSVSDALEQRRL